MSAVYFSIACSLMEADWAGLPCWRAGSAAGERLSLLDSPTGEAEGEARLDISTLLLCYSPAADCPGPLPSSWINKLGNVMGEDRPNSEKWYIWNCDLWRILGSAEAHRCSKNFVRIPFHSCKT